MTQMKDQIKTPEKELNEMELGNQSIRCRVQTGYEDTQGNQ